jgi:peptidoglycan/LPS O-acetylase OafA/YrhL
MPQKQDALTLNPPREALITPLDDLRGFAALIVIISHFSNETLQ